ncbi:enoyl-CoA hydratase [Nocardia asteroides]|uniref:enoyl-CoA hydratase n=1 Tax=Nocardia asteroides TaxID=1824 RepID=UPI001E5A45B1|nr:enoyl-CoA hydratase [Nocardia asteroides]UGT59834.1 enoyl-CoA hydratase [Nocardia asteroides]
MLGVNRDGDVVGIELQREDRRNALNTELVIALREAVLAAVADDARAIVISGRGKVFSAGADLSGIYSENFLDELLAMLHTIEAAPVPVISAIHGAAYGAAVQLAVASDLRVVDPDAYIAIPAARLGVSVDRWTAHRLASLIGGGPARTVLLGAEQISAADAYTFGFANKIGTVADAHTWAKSIAALAPLSLRHLKLVLNDDGTRQPENAQQRAALAAAWSSEDAAEARLAREQKRAPRFEGR